MSEAKRIKTALVSVYHKEGLDEIITKLHEEGVEFLSTGGTRQFIESLGFPCKAVEDLTTYPSILGGRVKTLHPKVFGGILCRRGLEQDMQQIEKYEIPEIDLVIVDLYPFEATVASGAEEQAIIEKIDIGGDRKSASWSPPQPPATPPTATRSVWLPVRWTRSTTPATWQSAWRSALLWALPLLPTSAASAPLPAM